MTEATYPAGANPATDVPCIPPALAVELHDLRELGHLLPPSAVTLIRVAGVQPALRLLRYWPAVQLVVPLRPAANPAGARRWQALANMVGEAAMPALVAHYGGGVLDVPACRDLLIEKRNRWVRARFDALTSLYGPALSAYAAVQEINLALAEAGWPLTLREVQKVVNETRRAAAEPADPPQLALPGIPRPEQ